MIGTCHTCGDVGELLDVESTGIKLCRACVRLQVEFAGEIVDARNRAWPDDVDGARVQRRLDEISRPVRHSQLHYTEVPGCPECIGWRRARL